ncbi:short-chain dehydrogenase [Clostridia bacterium]|nr:short-chain dehydrogenase [Clostridia bacterium]
MKHIAIVTGASSGIGRHFVYQLVKDKKCSQVEEIWIIARRRERLQQLKQKINQHSSVSIKIFALDLQNKESIVQLKKELEKSEAVVSYLINAAGYGKLGSFFSGDFEEQIGMIDLNVKALSSLTHIVLPYCICGSHILQISSAVAFLPQPNFSVYSATKSFVFSFSRALRQELRKKNIWVTVVCPGPVNTEFFQRAQWNPSKKFYPPIIRASATSIVKKALSDAHHCKELSICPPLMQFFYVLSKLVPHRFVLNTFYHFNQRA